MDSDEDQDVAFDATKTQRSIRTYKGKLTSVIKVAENMVRIAEEQSPPPAFVQEDLKKQKVKADHIINQISDRYAVLIANEDADAEATRLQSNWDGADQIQ